MTRFSSEILLPFPNSNDLNSCEVAVTVDIEAVLHYVKVPDISAVFLDSCGGRTVIPTKKSLTLR